MRTVLVTGASRGIGYAVASALAADGWCVLGLARTATPPTPGVYGFTGDVEDPPIADILRMNEIDTLDALVHCAASQEPIGDVAEIDPDDWAHSVGVNLIGTYRVVHAALPFLLRSDDARLLLFSGGGSFSPRPHFSAYAAAKAGVVALMEALAGELPPHASVNCVAPGFVPTEIHAPTLRAGPDRVGRQEYRHATREAEGAMEAVVACVHHLLSPATRGLSGRTISAPYDDWAHLDQQTVPIVMASPAGSRTRHLIAAIKSMSRHPGAVLPCPVGATL